MFSKLNHLAITTDHYANVGMFYRAVFGMKTSGDTRKIHGLARRSRQAWPHPAGHAGNAGGSRRAVARNVCADYRDPAFIAETKKTGLSLTYGDGALVGDTIQRVMTGLDASSLAEIKDITLNRYN